MLLALARAFVSLLHPRMLWLMVWPVLAALLVWSLLAFAFWGQAAHWINLELQSWGLVQWMMTIAPLAFIVAHLAWVVLVVAFIPLVLVTATLLIGIFAMPAMVEHVANTSYPGLARLRGGTFAGSLWNSLVAVVVFLVLSALTLPLWVVPPLWPVLPVLLFAYLNMRVFRYDALADHASAIEMKTLFRRHGGELFGMGVVIALLGHVPVFGFFVGVYGALAFIHLCLARLQALRGEPLEGTAIRDRLPDH